MKKTFVLDTNVLLFDPMAMFAFEDNNVVIPIYVVEEVDNFKKEISELGQNARQISRQLDVLRENGSLAKGVAINKGGVLKVLTSTLQIPKEVATDRGNDSKILAVALELKNKLKNKEEVILITKDTNLRIRSDALDLKTENYEPEPVTIDELYTGFKEVKVSAELINKVFAGELNFLPEKSAVANQFLILKNEANESQSALAKVSPSRDHLEHTIRPNTNIWGITARNKEQLFALDLLLDDRIKLVTLVGKAGTGKTLLAIAAGLHLVSDERKFARLLVSRPIFPLGRDLGYLPGTIEEKLNPWMQPIFDNIDFLMSISRFDQRTKKKSYQELIDLDLMQIEPLTYIRGRSIAAQFLIVDEAQNLTPHEIKTIITRAGEGTKIVLTGDPYQIDHPYVDATNNGLVHVVQRFYKSPIYGHVTLKKGERSKLAEDAANLL